MSLSRVPSSLVQLYDETAMYPSDIELLLEVMMLPCATFELYLKNVKSSRRQKREQRKKVFLLSSSASVAFTRAISCVLMLISLIKSSRLSLTWVSPKGHNGDLVPLRLISNRSVFISAPWKFPIEQKPPAPTQASSTSFLILIHPFLVFFPFYSRTRRAVSCKKSRWVDGSVG